MQTKALYLCHYGRGYANQYDEQVVIGFFTEKNGYSPDDIQLIADLPIGGKIDLSDLSGHHTVTRLDPVDLLPEECIDHGAQHAVITVGVITVVVPMNGDSLDDLMAFLQKHHK